MAHIIKEYSTGGGEIDTKYYDGQEQAYLMKYQSVTSHGNESVPDADGRAVIGYYPGVAKITPAKYDVNDAATKKGVIHIPIHSPPTVIRTPILQSLQVEFTNQSDASVDSLSVYYDTEPVFTASTAFKSSFHVDLTTKKELEAASYKSPAGICLRLTLLFPNKDSVIELASVTLAYQVGA